MKYAHLEAFSKRLKEAMERKRITQEELAEKAGVSQPGISAYLNGKRSPKIKTIKAIADVLGVDATYLLGIDRKTEAESVLAKYFSLDEQDRGKVNGYMDALSADGKYK